MATTRCSVGSWELRDPRAVEPLLARINDPKKGVRENTAWALGNIGNESAIEGLTHSLTERFT